MFPGSVSCKGFVSLRVFEPCSLRININGRNSVLNGERRVRASSRDSRALPGNALRCVSFALAPRGPMVININAPGQFMKSALLAMMVRSIQEKAVSIRNHHFGTKSGGKQLLAELHP